MGFDIWFKNEAQRKIKGAQMSKGTTYTATDMHGTVHTRYSVRHIDPQYLFAVVRHGANGQPATKNEVSYHSSETLARNERDREAARQYRGVGVWSRVECCPLAWRAGR